jgi:hypothetical protein
MQYRVLQNFHDLQDAKKTKKGIIYHAYQAGDTYPRKGLNPSELRIAELASAGNAQGMPLIEAVSEDAGSD